MTRRRKNNSCRGKKTRRARIQRSKWRWF